MSGNTTPQETKKSDSKTFSDTIISECNTIANHIKRISASRLFWLVMILLLLFVAILVLFTFMDWPDSAGLTVIISFVCAIIGAFVTMLITERQLENQTKHGLETQKNSKVFEEKLDVYKSYINTLCEILTRGDGNFSDNDRLKLAFATALLSLHTGGDNMRKIAEDLKAIVEERRKQNGTLINQKLINRLLSIVEQLKLQLYEGDSIQKVNIDDSAIIEIGEIFNDAYDFPIQENTENEEESPQKQERQEITKDELNLAQWNRAVEKWRKDGWKVWEGWKEQDPKNQTFVINRTNSTPGEITAAHRNGHAIITVKYGADQKFAEELIANPPKNVTKSRRQNSLWWTDENILGDANKIVEEMHWNPKLQEFLINLIEESMQRIKDWEPSSKS